MLFHSAQLHPRTPNVRFPSFKTTKQLSTHVFVEYASQNYDNCVYLNSHDY